MSVSNLRHQLAYDDLRGWLAEAERLGELRAVSGASWQEEIGMAADIVCRSETAPAILFDDVPGCRAGFRVLVNLFGGRRMHMTLGFPSHLNKAELSEAYLTSHVASRSLIPYEVVADGPIFENVLMGDAVDLDIFPAPMWHEKDGGRYIGTGCYNVSMDPETKWINLGTYRIMTRDKTSVTYNANLGKHGQVHQRKWAARKEMMPVALVIGGDPIIFLLGGSDIADGVCEYDVAGGLRGKPVRVVKGKLTGLPIPADAEIVLEGFVHPDTLVDEGPFGDWPGTYSDKGRKRPLVDIKAIYHRNDPIILGCPPQKPPDEYSRIASVTRSAALLQNIRDGGVVPRGRRRAHADRCLDQAALPRTCASGRPRRGLVPGRQLREQVVRGHRRRRRRDRPERSPVGVDDVRRSGDVARSDEGGLDLARRAAHPALGAGARQYLEFAHDRRCLSPVPLARPVPRREHAVPRARGARPQFYSSASVHGRRPASTRRARGKSSAICFIPSARSARDIGGTKGERR